MNKPLLITLLFIAGLLTGMALMRYTDIDGQETAVAPVRNAAQTQPGDVVNPFKPVATSNDARLAVLEEQLQSIERRLDELENRPPAQTPLSEDDTAGNASPATMTASRNPVDALTNRIDPLLTQQNLLKAGIDTARADEIIRMKNKVDFKRLDLQDRATREGYIGTERFMRELEAINAEDIDLREALGDAAYDRFLYNTGQRNRVTATAVMQGSPAETAGLVSGDVILSYNGERLFDWNALKSATTQGERGEYVNITVLRQGQQITLWIPRGPLGVRLGTTRLQPDS